MHQMMEMEQEQDDGRGGALVEEAKRLMQDDIEENQNQQQQVESSGPKIKMGKLGRRKPGKKDDSSKATAAPGVKMDQQWSK